MIKEMKLEINNFGPINNANIELKKLNIIAGVNGSGKSTSSKLLSCFLTANSNEGYYLANKSIYDRFVSLVFNWDMKISDFGNNLHDSLPLRINLFKNNENLREKSFNSNMKIQFNDLRKIIKEYDLPDENSFYNELASIEKLLEFNNDEHNRYYNVTTVLLNSEFNFDELKSYGAHVHFYGEMNNCEFSHKIDFEKDRIGATISKGYVNCLNFDDVVYIDSPSIFDYEGNLRVNPRNSPNHINILSKQINRSKNESDVYDNIVNERISKFQNKIQKIIAGEIYFDSKKGEYLFKKENQSFSMENTASGIKQMGIIQILLENRVLKENSFLIMDEPEVNLHPEWQIRFAELLVLLIKELNIYIYINSHSPHFIEALEVYSGKYGLVDESKFYLSCENENGKFDFEEMDRDDLVILYNNLGDPYDVINKVRADNMKHGIF